MSHRITASLAALALALPVTATAQDAGALRAQIEKADQAWQTAYNAGDAAAIAALYSEDAKVMAPGAETVSGRAAIQDFFKQGFTQSPGAKNALTTNEILSGGDYVIALGGYVATAADGSHLDHGSYTTVYKKVDGAWKIYRDTWNSSMAH
jgi:uncharacterized protein (TIGR02246 family)